MSWRSSIVRTLFFGGALVLTIGGGRGQGGPAPPPGQLSKIQEAQLAEWANKVIENVMAGDFGAVVRLAREALSLREQWQGKQHWQTVTARFQLTRWQRLPALPAAEEKNHAPGDQAPRAGAAAQ